MNNMLVLVAVSLMSSLAFPEAVTPPLSGSISPAVSESISPAVSESIELNADWDKEFVRKSSRGVFLLCKGSSSSCTTNNLTRATTAYIPASTFKIANALIALETGVINDEFQIFKWDGRPRAMKQWEQDLTLREAIQLSALPVFQEIARQIGEKRMQKYVKDFYYGNANIEGGIDTFWLSGQLRISAFEQIQFLESLYLNRLSASKENQLIVKGALVSEATAEYVMYSKTGFSGFGTKEKPGIGWFVGWVIKGTEVYFFALNMDIDQSSQLDLRKSIPRGLLVSEGVI